MKEITDKELYTMAKLFKKLWQKDADTFHLEERDFIISIADVLGDLVLAIRETQDDISHKAWGESPFTSYELPSTLRNIAKVVENYNTLYHMCDVTLHHAKDAEKKQCD